VIKFAGNQLLCQKKLEQGIDKHSLAIYACVQMWKLEDRAKSLSLSPNKGRKQSTKAKISLREIARRKRYAKEAMENFFLSFFFLFLRG